MANYSFYRGFAKVSTTADVRHCISRKVALHIVFQKESQHTSYVFLHYSLTGPHYMREVHVPNSGKLPILFQGCNCEQVLLLSILSIVKYLV